MPIQTIDSCFSLFGSHQCSCSTQSLPYLTTSDHVQYAPGANQADYLLIIVAIGIIIHS